MHNLFSVKMRAAQGGPHEAGGRHISGAERIVPAAEVAAVAEMMARRAQGHERGRPDFINIKIESLSGMKIKELTSLPVYTLRAGNCGEGLLLARRVLELAGVDPEAARLAVNCLLEGTAASGRNMRGAVLMDVHTGCRLESDAGRGVRVSYMDYHPSVAVELSPKLAGQGLDNDHVREALCLATKVASVTSIIAELCWSDDPGYTTGYVASPRLGYVRICPLKEKGSDCGGRVFFFDSGSGRLTETFRQLEKEPCLITALGKINAEMSYQMFVKNISTGGAPDYELSGE